MDPKYSDVTVKLTGEDGNAFVIIGRVRRALKRSGYPEAADEFTAEAQKGDYDALLRLAMETVNVE